MQLDEGTDSPKRKLSLWGHVVDPACNHMFVYSSQTYLPLGRIPLGSGGLPVFSFQMCYLCIGGKSDTRGLRHVLTGEKLPTL